MSNILWCLAAYAVAFLISAERAKKFAKSAWEKGVADGEAAAVKEIVKD